MAQAQAKIPPRPLSFSILHGTLMAAILFLVVTGFYIHRPFVADGGGFLMSLMRGVHFFAAAVLIIAVVLRITAMFVGANRDWRFFIPNVEDMKLIPKVIVHYLRLGAMPTLKKRYNPLQMISYVIVILMAIFQIITGFALLYPDGWLRGLNYGLFSSEIGTRVCHHIFAWLFVIFLIVHVYLGIRDSFQEMKEMHLLAEGQEK